jgi:N-acetyl-anhydromuramyl-L-alanine amidase AmpD
MNLRKLLLTGNNCYIAGRKIAPAGIMLHSTGANNPELKRYVCPDDGLLGANRNNNHWNQPKPDGREVCVHAFIGKLADGAIATYQTLPWEMRGWHAGGKANDTYIGFEICEDGKNDAGYFTGVYREAVELCAMLCRTYGIKPEKPALLCHSEGSSLGIASAHSDVMHWFPMHGKSMDTFRADVKKAMEAAAEPVSEPEPTSVAVIYRVRKTREDGASQIGAYKELANAVAAAEEKKAEVYRVFDENGKVVHDPSASLTDSSTPVPDPARTCQKRKSMSKPATDAASPVPDQKTIIEEINRLLPLLSESDLKRVKRELEKTLQIKH